MAARRSASAVSSPGSRREPRQFLDRMAQPVGLALRALDLGAMRSRPRLRASRRSVHSRADLGGVALEPAEGIEQRAVGRRIDQRALVVLAVDFDQRRAERSAAPAR